MIWHQYCSLGFCTHCKRKVICNTVRLQEAGAACVHCETHPQLPCGIWCVFCRHLPFDLCKCHSNWKNGGEIPGQSQLKCQEVFLFIFFSKTNTKKQTWPPWQQLKAQSSTLGVFLLHRCHRLTCVLMVQPMIRAYNYLCKCCSEEQNFLACDLPLPSSWTLPVGWHVFRCRCAVCHAAVACSAASVWGLDSSCAEQSVGDSLSVATAPGSV